jgi:hypothetical protein
MSGLIETLTPEGRADLQRVRDLTDRLVAANLMIQGWKTDPPIVETLAAAGVRHVFTSAGDPALSRGFSARLQQSTHTFPPHGRHNEIRGGPGLPHDAEQGSRDHGVVLGHQDPVHHRRRELRRLG